MENNLSYYTSITIITWMSLGIFAILIHENNRIQNDDKRLNYYTCAVIAAAALCEWIGVKINGDPDHPKWLLSVVKCGDYILTPMAAVFFVRQMKVRNRKYKLLVGLLVLNTVLQIISLFTGWMVLIDEQNHYSHGPLYDVYAVLYILIIALVIFEVYSYGKNFPKNNLASLYAICLLILTGILLQETSGGDIRTSYLSLTFGAIMLFIHNTEFSHMVTDSQLVKDDMTGLQNRYAYKNALKELNKSGELPEDLAVFMIDINNLKYVNDKQGHDAGDELIRGASGCIEAAFGKTGKCYRTGGDEFVVLAYMGKELAEKTKELLNVKAEAWKGELVNELSFAAGYALACEHKGFTAEQLISAADQAMYAAKYEYYLKSGRDRRKFRMPPSEEK